MTENISGTTDEEKSFYVETKENLERMGEELKELRHQEVLAELEDISNGLRTIHGHLLNVIETVESQRKNK